MVVSCLLKCITVTKYAKEARGLFGVAVVNGVGMKAAPFNYTNRLVVGMKRMMGVWQ